jgi:5-methylcytosine-specific restriction endonuclease McrA
MKRSVLLLNASEEVIKVISWKKAICLLESGRAKRPFAYKQNYKIKGVSGDYNLPAAIVLVRYVHIPYESKMQPTRKNIFRRDNHTCQYCGHKSKDPSRLTIDHVHPKSKGGDSSWTNLVTACPKCNGKKSNYTLKECKMKLKSKPRKPSQYGLELVGLDENGKKLWSRWIDI